jgi:predicted nuclease with TOPRIM domain
MDLEQMRELGQQLTNHHQEVSRCPHHELASRLVTAEMEIQGLKDEVERLQEENQRLTEIMKFTLNQN